MKTKTFPVRSVTIATTGGDATVSLVCTPVGADGGSRHTDVYSVSVEITGSPLPSVARRLFLMAAAMLDDAEELESRMRPPTMKELRDRL